jgi:predicted transcriptional regulator
MTQETERPDGSYVRISIRLDSDRGRRLVREARTSAKTQSSIPRNALDEHWALQDELAAPIGEVGDGKAGRLIHTLLAETEERIAGSYDVSLRRLHRRVDALFRRIELLSVMVAQAYFAYLSHTPPIPDELRDSAIASAKERYTRWEDSIVHVLARDLFVLATRAEESRSQQGEGPDPSCNPGRSCR